MGKTLFETGKLRITRGVNETIPVHEAAIAMLRYLDGDWGDLCEEDWELNDYAVRTGLLRLYACYHTSEGEEFLIITEADHSVTTILLPSEY